MAKTYGRIAGGCWGNSSIATKNKDIAHPSTVRHLVQSVAKPITTMTLISFLSTVCLEIAFIFGKSAQNTQEIFGVREILTALIAFISEIGLFVTIFQLIYGGQLKGKDVIIEAKEEKLKAQDKIHKADIKEKESDIKEKELKILEMEKDREKLKEERSKYLTECQTTLSAILDEHKYTKMDLENLVTYAAHRIEALKELEKEKKQITGKARNQGIRKEYQEKHKCESLILREILYRRLIKEDQNYRYYQSLKKTNINTYNQCNSLEGLREIVKELEIFVEKLQELQ